MKKSILTFLILLFACYHGYSQELNSSVRIKLKSQADRSYLATEDAEMKVLSLRHDVEFRQTSPGARNPELLLYYTLTVKSSRNRENKESAIKDFLSTGKFEDDVYEYGIAHGLCAGPISVNDPDQISNTHGWALRMIQAPCAWAITKGSSIY